MTQTTHEGTSNPRNHERDTDYIALNAELNKLRDDGSFNLEADKKAAREYFLNHINQNTVFFHSLSEKLNYLVENDYYEKEVLDQYSDEFIKSLFQKAYSYKFRFESFIGAYKYYTSYTLKTFDGKRYLERFEDRVSINALYLAAGDEKMATKLVDDMMSGRFQPATPTFLNAGKKSRGELVSCFLIRFEDSMESIGRNINSALQLSKRGGGVALNLSNLRETGAPIKHIENQASGVIPVMKMLEDAFSYANQLGARQGAGAVYLNAHHPDIFEFLDTKRENADEKVRIKTLSTGVVIPDITIKLAVRNEPMYLFSPYDVERVYGKKFTDISITEHYYEMVENPDITKKKTSARKLLDNIAKLQFESGYPYIMFEDHANKSNPIKGRINMSNLCVTGDTRLLTDNGYVKISELYENQNDFKVVVDERARTMDLNASGVSVQDSTKAFKTAENADILKVTTKEGYSLRATPWHKMYVNRDGELLKIDLQDVRVGDKLLVQPDEGAFGNSNEPELAYLAGLIAGDGTIVDAVTSAGNATSTARIYLYGQKASLAKSVEAKVAEALKGHEEMVSRQSTLSPKFVKSGNADRLALQSAPLAKLLANKGMVKSTKLSVPEFVKSGNKQTQVAYLSGLFQMDGCITGIGPSIELGSINKELLEDVQKMLVNLGVFSRIYRKHAAGKKAFYNAEGEMTEYDVAELWTIVVNGKKDGMKLFNTLEWSDNQRQMMEAIISNYKTDKVYNTHKFFSTVDSIVSDGTEDVYDVTVENGHSIIFDGVVTGNCTEILQVNSESVFNEDLSYATVGKDISCNLGSLNIAKVFDGDDFASTVETAVRALTSVSDKSNIACVPSVAHGNAVSHAIGLGQMNLHGFLGREHIFYNSPEAVDFTNIYFYAVLYQCLRASHKIAVERSETFEGFEDSDYANGSFFDKYIDKDWSVPETEKVRALLKRSSIYIPTVEDWKQLKADVMKDGIYNSNLQAVPPTGSISYINNSTSSIHPIASRIEARKEGRIGRVYYAQPHMTNENAEYFQDAYEIGPKAIIDVYAAAQQHVDQGLSLTLFYNDDSTTGDLKKMYLYAWSKGIKTMYYARVRQKPLLGTEVEGLASNIRIDDPSAFSKRVAVDPVQDMLSNVPDGEECESCAL